MAETTDRDSEAPQAETSDRREFMNRASGIAMVAGLVGGYGAFGAVAARYLYPARPDEGMWQFVADLSQLGVGDSLLYRAPAGETVNITRGGSRGTAADFVALSSTCPHLGCQVHWQGPQERYFCPCHNGTFDSSGKATGGPPADAGQSLGRYPLRVEGGLLFIEVPATRLIGERRRGQTVSNEGCGITKPGHDRCLEPGNRFGGPKKA